jgi:hypothetical protein
VETSFTSHQAAGVGLGSPPGLHPTVRIRISVHPLGGGGIKTNNNISLVYTTVDTIT